MSTPTRRVAVVGAGWAGLAAATQATSRGADVTLFEAGPQAGGRARSTVLQAGWEADNGQHILIGAYRETLAWLQGLGVDTRAAFWRGPLDLRDAAGHGLRWPPGPAVPGFLRAVLGARGWRWGDRLALLRAAARWQRDGMRAAEGLSVAAWSAGLPPRVRAELIEPLCVAALNTPADEASAAVLLNVLREAWFGGPGGSDLLLPARPLGRIAGEPALAWLQSRGASLRLGHAVRGLALDDAGRILLQVSHGGRPQHGEPFDAVVLATGAPAAARLVQPLAADWAAVAAALPHEPIATVWLRDPGWRPAAPMQRLRDGPRAPAQFLFALDAFQQAADQRPHGIFTAVASACGPALVEGGLDALAAAVHRQLQQALGRFAAADAVVHATVERRATFASRVGLQRPAARVLAGRVWAAGDHVEGPFPATLEGAVRSGLAAGREAAA